MHYVKVNVFNAFFVSFLFVCRQACLLISMRLAWDIWMETLFFPVQAESAARRCELYLDHIKQWTIFIQEPTLCTLRNTEHNATSFFPEKTSMAKLD